LAQTESASRTLRASPSKIETKQLPHRVEAETARHNRIAFEMALKEPEVFFDVEFGDDFAFFECAARAGDFGDAVKHQHRRQRKLGIARAKQMAFSAFDQILECVAGFGNEIFNFLIG